MATDSAYLPSVAFVRPDGGLLVGTEAERQAPTDPARVVRQLTRRIGDRTPLLIGGVPVPAEVLAARLISWIVDLVAERERGVATSIAVTHPASWGEHRVSSLRRALSAHGLPGVTLLAEPQAAALALETRIAPGSAVAVFDLGGASFEAAVLRTLGDDRFTVAGRPERVEVGGLDFDEVIFEHVRTSLGDAWDELDPADPAVLGAAARLRRECTAAKEALSADTDVLIPVALPGIDTHVRLARAEFEELIRPAVDETVAALLRALRSAEVAPAELAAVLLVGGSARIPLVTQAVSEQLGRPVSVAPDPKGTIAIGAALTGREPEPEPIRTVLRPPPIAAPVDDPVLRMLPSLAGPPRPVERSGFWSRIPRTVSVGAAATVLLALAAAGGVALLTNRTGPIGADADPLSGPVSRIVEPTTPPDPPTTTARRSPDPTTKAPPPRPRTTTPPRTRTPPDPPTTTARRSPDPTTKAPPPRPRTTTPPRTRTTTPTPSTRNTTTSPPSSTATTRPTTTTTTTTSAGAR